ncbi:hypothetical protein [uncultured Cardiobacterium sp.]|uniref:hypothetical protein n=1 Tax=uncultured Cardiobacterium sp. TaxID=417619 RepID=UPI0026052FD1|nr:hypothetical protein [uncultured Cardiobacterium sp.]
MTLTILCQDEHLGVVNKPVGIPAPSARPASHAAIRADPSGQGLRKQTIDVHDAGSGAGATGHKRESLFVTLFPQAAWYCFG